MIRKISDTFNDGYSAADNHFTVSEQKRFYRLFRKNSELPIGFATNGNNTTLTSKEFSLRGLQFGNWLSTEDRYDYLSIFWLSMKDMNKVLKFKKTNLGMDNHLGVCFGSRGVPRARAHFNPQQMIINLSRYEDNQRGDNSSKMTRFIMTGGTGSLAHEYGHFIDAIFGSKIDVSSNYFLTGNFKSVKWDNQIPDKSKNPLRYQMRMVLDKALLNPKTKSGYTRYGVELKTLEENRDYYCSNVEVWARLFEMYVCYKLKQMNIENIFLTKSAKVYDQSSYFPTWKEFGAIAKEIDKLLILMRKYL